LNFAGASFSFLFFNLFLAWIPYLISQFFGVKKLAKPIFLLLIIFWLVFFPNALYVVTDLFHLWPRSKGSPWFDLVMIFSFAFTSFLLGFSSLRNLEVEMAKKIHKPLVLNSVIFLIIYLGSFGVYLGRFRRWNSWDLITDLAFIEREGMYLFENPFEDMNFYATTFVFAVFCYIFYHGIFHFAKNHK
jgi:uncharacterized membrane protein